MNRERIVQLLTEAGGSERATAWVEADQLRELCGEVLASRDRDEEVARGPTRDGLGRIVRGVWVRWALEQPDAASHPNWTKPYDELEERDKEVDRRIGEALFGAGCAAQRPAHWDESGELVAALKVAVTLARSASVPVESGVLHDRPEGDRLAVVIGPPGAKRMWFLHERHADSFTQLAYGQSEAGGASAG